MASIKKFYTYSTGDVNNPPVAVLAYTNISALIGSIVQLDARGSYDPEQQPLIFKWSFTQVPNGSNLTDSNIKDIRPNRSAVSFIPDCTGLYVVKLVVNDGELDSTPITASANIQLSRVPIGEGLVPDAHFLWDYISNFWNLVEDKEYITSVWSSMMQVIGSDLIKLWSIDYNKSLDTIQATVQRHWCKVTSSTLIPPTATQSIVAGYTGHGSNGVSGKIGEVPGIGLTSVFRVPLAEFDFTSIDRNYGAKGRVLSVNSYGATISRVANTDTESLAFLSADKIPDGLIGVNWRLSHLLKVSSLNLEALGARAGDLLVLEVKRGDSGVVADLLAQVTSVDGSRIGFEFTLQDLEQDPQLVDLELFKQLVRDLRIVPVAAADADAAAAARALLSFVPPGFNLHTRPFTQYLLTIRAKKIIHNSVIPMGKEVTSIPALQERIVEPLVLRENLDYVMGDSGVEFTRGLFTPRSPAPEVLWAEVVFLDNNPAIEKNFGRSVDFNVENQSAKTTRVPYLSAVRGLLYAAMNGPTVANVRLGTQILLGLPYAEVRGRIVEREDAFSVDPYGVSLGRLLVDDLDATDTRTGTRHLYFYPTIMGLENNPSTGLPYAVGGILAQFSPISRGVLVEDYVKSSRWWAYGLAGLEVLKFFVFRVAVDTSVFNLQELLLASKFVKAMKPAYTKVMLAAIQGLQDNIGVTDVFGGAHTVTIHDSLTGLTPSFALDDQGHGVGPFSLDSWPLSPRMGLIGRDGETFATVVGGTPRLGFRSATGWATGDVRGASGWGSMYAGSPPIEGDVVLLLAGAPDGRTQATTAYTVDQVVSEHELILGWETSLSLDMDNQEHLLVPGGLGVPLRTGLPFFICRRMRNPLVVGADLSTADSGVASTVTMQFLSNEVSVGDHLIIDGGDNAGEYLINGISSIPPFISQLSVALVNLDGSVASIVEDAGQAFYVIRPLLVRKSIDHVKITNIDGVYAHIESMEQEDSDLPAASFTPFMAGCRIAVMDGQNTTNSGVLEVTEYLSAQKLVVRLPSAISTLTASARAQVHCFIYPGYERILELVPKESFQLVLKGVS